MKEHPKKLAYKRPPVSSYFSTSFFETEKLSLFQTAPRYVGHMSMIPEHKSYYVLPDKSQVLVNYKNNPQLLSNICRHRQAILLEGKGKQENIVCPLHRWTYDLSGKLLGAPHFPENPCLNLKSTSLENWQGLLFEKSHPNVGMALSSLQSPFLRERFDFSSYQLERIQNKECSYNWKTFLEVYLEDYHIVPFHQGLGSFVSCENLQWEFGTWYSVQTVGIYQNLKKAGSSTYKMQQEQILKLSNGETPEYGAIWLACYPNIMLEWYPYMLVVSTLSPQSPRKTTNVIQFFFPEEIRLFEREFVECAQAAYMETAAEDDQIAERIEAGRHILFEQDQEDFGPYQQPLEEGMAHFHKFWSKNISIQEQK